jgi:hypothetical protein
MARLGRNPKPIARAALEEATLRAWTRVVPLASLVPQDLALALALGGAEALTLALQANAGLVLLDESAARSRAAKLGIRFTGALGILRRARQIKRIPSLLHSPPFAGVRSKPSVTARARAVPPGLTKYAVS